MQSVGILILNKLDHFIKENLREKYYGRYMDDFYIIHESAEHLAKNDAEIQKHINSIGFVVNAKKTAIRPLNKGIKFLGFIFKLTASGKVLMFPDPKRIKEERRRLTRMAAKVRGGKLDKKRIDEHYTTWKSHVAKGNSFKLLQRMDAFYKNLKWR